MPMNPDGWKDEEGDVDNTEEMQKRFDRRVEYPEVKSPDTSAQTCGCDLGAKWYCSRYPECAFGRRRY